MVSLLALLALYPVQGVVTNAEVVGNLVTHYFAYLCFNFSVRAAFCLDGLLEDGYFVWQNQVVASAPTGLRYSFIKTQQLSTMPESQLAELPSARPVLYQHIDIFQFALKLRWQFLDGFDYKGFEPLPLHIPQSAWL